MRTRRAHPVLEAWHGLMVAALLLCAQLAAAQGTDVCVYLTGSNGKVGGLQVDLSWDPGCMTAESGSGNAAQCASAPSVSKSVQTALFGSSLRAIFFSFSDKSPIPDNTELFCCKFTMAGSQTGSCCSVRTNYLRFSDPKGGVIYDKNVQLGVLVGGGAPCVSSGPSGSADNPVRPPALAPAIVQPPVVSAPAAPAAPAARAPGALAPALPQPNVPAQVPPVQGLAAEAPTAGLAPTEAVPSPVVTPEAAKTPTAAKTAARTPTVPAATPQLTPEAQGTATQAVTPATAAPTTAAPATTPTPKHKRKAQKERLH